MKDTLHFKKVIVQPPVGQDGTVVLLGHEFGTAKATGRDYQCTWAQVYSFAADGRISHMLQYFDPAEILRALAEPSTLPTIPAGFGLPFFYSSLTNFEVMHLVDPGRVAPYLEGTGLAAATFGGRACASYNYQGYTGPFPNGTGFTQEIELNIVSYPEALAGRTVEMSFQEFVLGNDQTKLFGSHRVHVPCDSPPAIAAGVQLFGEPKFQTTFATSIPALNDPSVETWTVTCNDPDDPKVAIFTGTADLRGLPVLTADISPQTEYGRHDGELIGCRWNILQPYCACLLGAGESKRVGLQLGQSRHPMRADLAALIGEAPAAAVRTFQSAPAAIQSRAYFV
ncbi:MAG TPA: hypothetical protein VGC56_10490 [Allosphingosinicella sp.]